MGNSIPALHSTSSGSAGSQVQVVFMNGDHVNFESPVTARTVMRRFPHHRVIHCSTTASSSNAGREVGSQRRKIFKTTLQPQNHLKAEQDYLLVPKSSTIIKSIADSWVMFALNKSKEKKKSLQRPRRQVPKKTPALVCVRKAFATFFKISSPCLTLQDERKRSMPLKYDKPTAKSKELPTSSNSKDSKGYQSVKSRSHASIGPSKSNSTAGHNKDEKRSHGTYNQPRKPADLNSNNRSGRSDPSALSKITATAAVPDVRGYKSKPSPETHEEFKISFYPVVFRHRTWRPALLVEVSATNAPEIHRKAGLLYT